MKKTDKKKLKIVVDGVHQIISGLLSIDADEDQNPTINPNNSTKKAAKSINEQKTTGKSDGDTSDII